MDHKLTIEGATAAHVDAALALLAPTGQWRGIHLYKDVDKAHDWRQCQSTWHMWNALKDSGVEDPEAVIRTYELPGRCLVVFLDGQELYFDLPRPAIGEALDALAVALLQTLQPPADTSERRPGPLRLEDRPDWPIHLEALARWEALQDEGHKPSPLKPQQAAVKVEVPLHTLQGWRRRRDDLSKRE